MDQTIQNLKEKMLKDYKNYVWECLYYANLSSFRTEKIVEIKKQYKFNFIDNYDEFINQFKKLNFEELENILWIINIEAENEWTNANRCEAIALILWEYLKNQL